LHILSQERIALSISNHGCNLIAASLQAGKEIEGTLFLVKTHQDCSQEIASEKFYLQNCPSWWRV
jgi:hypothetical protein